MKLKNAWSRTSPYCREMCSTCLKVFLIMLGALKHPRCM